MENMYVQKRYLIAFLAFFGYVNMYCLRTNLSMALVEMTTIRPTLLENGTYVHVSVRTFFFLQRHNGIALIRCIFRKPSSIGPRTRKA